jgi:predicted nucleic acid-binding Zn ribbon protein
VLATDFLSAERRARLLTKWECVVREGPDVAGLTGPPNWLVKERERKGEGHEAAAVRVRREYGLAEPSGIREVIATAQRDWCMECGKPIRKGDNFCPGEGCYAAFRGKGIVTRIVTEGESLQGIVTEPEESLQRLCEVCGGSMEGRGMKATVCSGACRVRRKRQRG